MSADEVGWRRGKEHDEGVGLEATVQQTTPATPAAVRGLRTRTSAVLQRNTLNQRRTDEEMPTISKFLCDSMTMFHANDRRSEVLAVRRQIKAGNRVLGCFFTRGVKARHCHGWFLSAAVFPPLAVPLLTVVV
jgi:hypothetical protein